MKGDPFKQAAGSFEPQAQNAAPIAYVEAKPRGFVFDANGRLV
ncbi:MAG: hypothetical protein Q4A13_11140 [Fretibacterium sp.]|nr:hypothetical protein [Fretibacterium sp. OH1220_COT-178]MDO4787486.1 hypothetical protein [Fretibacterium sp.]